MQNAHVRPDFPGKFPDISRDFSPLRGDEQMLLEGHVASGACVPAVKSEIWSQKSSDCCDESLDL